MVDKTAKEKFKLGYRPSLDGLRGVAVLAVITLHAYIPFTLPNNIKILGNGGFLGVDIFFVLSGFLITALLLQERESNGRIGLKNFYARRALRLLPALFVFVAVCVLHSIFFRTPEESSGALGDIAVITFYLSNWIPTNLYSLRHTWSLAVEEQFYLIYPVLLIGMIWLIERLKLGRKWIIYFLLFLVLVITVYRTLIFAQFGFTMRIYTGSDMRADSLLFGCLAAMLVAWELLPQKQWFINLAKAAALAAAGLLLYLVLMTKIDSSFMYYGGFTIVASAVSVIIISLQNSPPKILKSVLEWKVLVWIGRLSYGIYLWHKLVYMVIDSIPSPVLIPSETMRRIVLPLTIKIGSSLVIAAVSFYWIEKPFLRLKKRFEMITPTNNDLEVQDPRTQKTVAQSLCNASEAA